MKIVVRGMNVSGAAAAVVGVVGAIDAVDEGAVGGVDGGAVAKGMDAVRVLEGWAVVVLVFT